MTTYFDRINYIAALLSVLGVPYTMNKINDGYQLRFLWCEGDVACHTDTHGAKNGMVETYEFPWDEDYISVMIPAAAAVKIANYYFECIGES